MAGRDKENPTTLEIQNSTIMSQDAIMLESIGSEGSGNFHDDGHNSLPEEEWGFAQHDRETVENHKVDQGGSVCILNNN